MSERFRFSYFRKVNFRDIYEEIKSIIFFFAVWVGPIFLLALIMPKSNDDDLSKEFMLGVLTSAWTILFFWWYFVKAEKDIKKREKEIC
ncbi:MAG: hypothetical protein NTW44_07810 [Nitrospirae bacterium]|nr:hypothetical protein [Nitrospirota bacterium]